MSLDEMIAAKPLPASDSSRDFAPERDPLLIVESKNEPELALRVEQLSDASGDLWGVDVLSSDGPALPVVRGKVEHEVTGTGLKLDEPGLTTDSYRPPWLECEFFPRIAPRYFHTRGILEQLSKSWPWSTVGKVFAGRGPGTTPQWAGSGVMVGRDLLLTAGHLAPWGAGQWFMEFVPLFASGAAPFGRAFVKSYLGVQASNLPSGLDYVICRLYTPIGDRCGWMGSKWWSDEDEYEDRTWTSVGYPKGFMNGQRPAVRFEIGVKDIDGDGDGLEIETVDFATEGWSGGPLWGFIDNDAKVIGIESGYETDGFDPQRSVFAGGAHMVNLVKSPPT
jgi:hypothetical protein